MDADVARMMADLGQDRHDFLVTCDEDVGDRVTEADSNAKQGDGGIIHRARVTRVRNPVRRDSASASKLREWNDPMAIEENTKQSWQNLVNKAGNMVPSKRQGQTTYVPTMPSRVSSLQSRSSFNTAPRKLTHPNADAPTGRGLPVETSEAAMQPKEELQMHLIQSWAEKWAASPGADRDAYYKKYPDHLPYLRPAEKKLIKKAFELAKDPEGRETEFYLVMNKDQRWMFEEACRAKDMFENGRKAEMDAYYTANPQFIDFRKCAEVNLKPKVKTAVTEPCPITPSNVAEPIESTQTTPATHPNRPLTPIPAPTPTQLASLKKRPDADHFTSRIASTVSTEQGVNTNINLINASPCAVKKPSLSTVVEGAAPTQRYYHRSRFIESYGLDIDSPKEGSPTSPTSTDRASIDQPTKQSRLGGALHAVFRDIKGKLNNAEIWPLAAPVRVSLNVEATRAEYDPRETVGSIRAFVNHMKAKASTSSSGKKPSKYKSADDEVWWTTGSESGGVVEMKGAGRDDGKATAVSDPFTYQSLRSKELAEGVREL